MLAPLAGLHHDLVQGRPAAADLRLLCCRLTDSSERAASLCRHRDVARCRPIGHRVAPPDVARPRGRMLAPACLEVEASRFASPRVCLPPMVSFDHVRRVVGHFVLLRAGPRGIASHERTNCGVSSSLACSDFLRRGPLLFVSLSFLQGAETVDGSDLPSQV